MTQQDSGEKVVPMGIVFITIGLIVVLTTASILLFRPPMQETAVANPPLPVITVVITPIPNATATTEAAATNVATEISLPEGFVSLDDAQVSSLANQPQRIVIPSIAVDAPVVNVGLTAIQSGEQTVYQWQVPETYQAGWHNSSAPLGQPGNTVLNGHHNIFGEVFGKLVDLEVGAEIVVYDDELPHNFTVTDVQILPERDQPLATRLENAQWIEPTSDERLTLVTCWPHTDNSHRLIVVARPTDSGSN
ncbi:sortase [Candidatus Leptofilum sp.]|uniref:sortase n=1 Tax=Candidatus Leptofilum sp. TaxID=3241576 RepID=UPI003B5C3728